MVLPDTPPLNQPLDDKSTCEPAIPLEQPDNPQAPVRDSEQPGAEKTTRMPLALKALLPFNKPGLKEMGPSPERRLRKK